MGMVVGEFLFLVTKSRRLNLLSNYEICLQNFSFSSRNRRNNFWISPSLLHTREIIADFSFFCKNSCSLLEPENRYLFSSWNSRCGFHISLSLLDLIFWHPVNAWDFLPTFVNIYLGES